MPHKWIKSAYGHGEATCEYCGITNREAAVLSMTDEPCPNHPANAKKHEPTSTTDEYFIEALPTAFNAFAKIVHQNAVDKGFWKELDGLPAHIAALSRFALMHSELSEAVERIRKNPEARDEKCPAFTNLEVELADAVIRIMDFADAWGLNVGGAIRAKHDYNLTRPHMHGKNS